MIQRYGFARAFREDNAKTPGNAGMFCPPLQLFGGCVVKTVDAWLSTGGKNAFRR
jgi:hypothetical protein